MTEEQDTMELQEIRQGCKKYNRAARSRTERQEVQVNSPNKVAYILQSSYNRRDGIPTKAIIIFL